MVTLVNPREKDPSVAYRLYNAALSELSSAYAVSAGRFTCTLSAETTTVADARVQTGDIIILTPASAAAVSLDGWVYLSGTAAGSFTVTHGYSSLEARTWNYAAFRP